MSTIGRRPRRALCIAIAEFAVPASTCTITACPRPVAMANPAAMCIAVFSWGQLTTFGYVRPAFFQRAISSISGA